MSASIHKNILWTLQHKEVKDHIQIVKLPIAPYFLKEEDGVTSAGLWKLLDSIQFDFLLKYLYLCSLFTVFSCKTFRKLYASYKTPVSNRRSSSDC